LKKKIQNLKPVVQVTGNGGQKWNQPKTKTEQHWYILHAHSFYIKMDGTTLFISHMHMEPGPSMGGSICYICCYKILL
jgi:hypothetical protein